MINEPVAAWPLLLGSSDVSVSHFGQDTNWALLTSMLTAAKQVTETQQINFILILGDSLAHKYYLKFKKFAPGLGVSGYRTFTRKTFQFLTSMFNKYLANTPILLIVGNNDSYQGNYYSEVNGAFFREFTLLNQSLSHTIGSVTQQSANRGGYYVANLPNTNVRLVALNTNLFAKKRRGQELKIYRESNEEIKWLESQLQAAKQQNRQLLLAMHIPPTIDIYFGSQIHLFTLMTLWQADKIQQFEHLLNQYHSQIIGIMAGHLHSNWYHEIKIKEKERIPEMVTASVSPVFANPPTFKIYELMETNRIGQVATIRYSYLRNNWQMESDQNFLKEVW